jgi:hypothetical protein
MATGTYIEDMGVYIVYRCVLVYSCMILLVKGVCVLLCENASVHTDLYSFFSSLSLYMYSMESILGGLNSSQVDLRLRSRDSITLHVLCP